MSWSHIFKKIFTSFCTISAPLSKGYLSANSLISNKLSQHNVQLFSNRELTKKPQKQKSKTVLILVPTSIFSNPEHAPIHFHVLHIQPSQVCIIFSGVGIQLS